MSTETATQAKPISVEVCLGAVKSGAEPDRASAGGSSTARPLHLRIRRRQRTPSTSGWRTHERY